MVVERKKDASGNVRPPGQVQSLMRAFSILRAVADSEDGMRLVNIAERVGLAPSTVHRLLTTLESEQFVRFDAVTGHWQVGVDAFTVGNAFAHSENVLKFAQPHLKRLVGNFSETASIYLENDGELVCMGQVESRQMMRAITGVGGRVKMHCSGSGKAILAFWDDEDVLAMVEQHGLHKYTEHTLDSVEKLLKNLSEIRSRGFAIDDEEIALGVRCVATPILNHHGRPVAAISVSGPVTRLGEERLSQIGDAVRKIGVKLSLEIGGNPSKIDGF